METLLCIIALVTAYIYIKYPGWKAHNRLSPPGKTTDYMQMTLDRTIRGMKQREVDNKFNNGGYDVEADKYKCPKK